MVELVKILGAEPSDLSSVPGTHVLERTDSCRLSFDLHMSMLPSST